IAAPMSSSIGGKNDVPATRISAVAARLTGNASASAARLGGRASRSSARALGGDAEPAVRRTTGVDGGGADGEGTRQGPARGGFALRHPVRMIGGGRGSRRRPASPRPSARL